jgi:hypothetical protein
VLRPGTRAGTVLSERSLETLIVQALRGRPHHANNAKPDANAAFAAAPCWASSFSLVAFGRWWCLRSAPTTHVHALLAQRIVAERDASIADRNSVLAHYELLDLRFRLAAERTQRFRLCHTCDADQRRSCIPKAVLLRTTDKPSAATRPGAVCGEPTKSVIKGYRRIPAGSIQASPKVTVSDAAASNLASSLARLTRAQGGRHAQGPRFPAAPRGQAPGDPGTG